MSRAAIALAMLAAFASVGEATTLYVNAATGNDATPYAQNSAERPWASIGRAAWGSSNRATPNTSEAARAGDVVIVNAGTYAAPGTDARFDPVYNPANSGVDGNPIVFQAQGAVVLTLSASRGPVIGASSRNFVTWRGFIIDARQARTRPDTGPVVFFTTTGSSIEDCVIRGDPAHDPGDNHTGVRIEQSHRIRVYNNRISGFRTTQVNPVNGAGVQVYSSDGITVEHNEIFDIGSGVFLKGIPAAADAFVIRRNLIYNTVAGIIIHIVKASAEKPVTVSQNVVRDSLFGIQIRGFDGANDARHTRIVNNTIDRAKNAGFHLLGTVPPDTGHVFANNIITGSQWAVYAEGERDGLQPSRIAFAHNLYFGFSRMASVAGTDLGLSDWRSSLKQDAARPPTLATDPRYVDGAKHDYRLSPGSPARNAGIDTLDLDADGSTTGPINLGAYITDKDVIGPITK